MQLQKAATESWNTPKPIIDVILQLWPQIDLDPCSNEKSIVPALTKLDKAQDGLGRFWGYKSRVFVNPPYDHKTLTKVHAKAVLQRDLSDCEIVTLVPSKTDQEWFHKAMLEANAVCFIRGRVAFGDALQGAAFSSCLFYYGPQAAKFKTVFMGLGRCLSIE